MRIALFATCLGDTLFPNVVKATALLLARLGHDVVFPPGQTCCGQMHTNTGYQRDALPLVENYAHDFGDTSIDAVVAPSGSCVGSVRHQHGIVASRYGNDALRRQVGIVGAKTMSCRNCSSMSSGSPTSVPGTRTASPTTRPAIRCACSTSETNR
jgi:L-lactate dehydrogenase complex protein LldE